MKTYARKRFQSVIIVATLTMLIEYVMQLCISIVAGNVLGESALSAIALATPLTSFLIFLTYMISVGTTINISYQTGHGDRKLANRYFSQGFLLILILGSCISLLFLRLRTWIPARLGTSIATTAYLADYLYWLFLLPIPLMLNIYLYDILIIEGNEKICSVSSAVQLVSTCFLSWILCKNFGISGIMFGTIISMTIVVIMLTIYLIRRTTLRAKFAIDWHLLWPVFRCSLVDASAYLYTCLFQFVLNALILHFYSDRTLVVLSVILNIQSLFLCVFDGIGESISQLINVYRGEGFQSGIRKTMAVARPTAVAEGLIVTAAMLIFAEAIPGIFGITDPSLILETASAIRIYAFSAIGFSLILLYTSYFLYMNKVAFSVCITSLYLLVLPILLCVLLCIPFGVTGIWIGLTLSGPVALLIGAIIIWKRKGKKTFPDLLDPEQLERELNYDVPKTHTGIDELFERLKTDLIHRGIAKKLQHYILQETEAATLLLVQNGDDRNSIIECDLLFDDIISVILRDSGHYANLREEPDIQADYPYSLDELTPGLLSHKILMLHLNKSIIMTSGKNRIILKFSIAASSFKTLITEENSILSKSNAPIIQ